ncbi:hypothetical protein V8F33_008917 [Rhypophila sp. PSN 637]
MAGQQSTNTMTVDQLKTEFIHQRLELWLSKKQDTTALELAMKLTGLESGRVHRWPPKSQKSAISIPHADGLGFWYVFCDDNYADAPLDIQEKASKLWRYITKPDNAGTLKEVERALDWEILEKCHLMGMESDINLAQNLAKCPLTKKIHICAKNRLVECRLPPYFDPATPDAQSRFRFVAVDIPQSGEVDMKWSHLDWECTFKNLKDDVLAHSRSLFVPRDIVPAQIKMLESIKRFSNAVLNAKVLITRLKVQLAIDKEDTPFRDDDAELAVGWINVNMSKKDQPTNLLMADIYGITWTALHTVKDFKEMMQTAHEDDGKYPIFIQPWQLRYYRMHRDVRKVHAAELIYSRDSSNNVNPGQAT